MTLPARKTKHRALLALAATLVAGAGLLAPGLFRSYFDDFSFTSAVVIAATRESFTLTTPVALPLLPNVMIESGRLSVPAGEPERPRTGAEVLALLNAGKAQLILEDGVLSVAPTQSTDPTSEKAAEALAPVLAALMKLSFSQLSVRNGLVRLGRDGSEILANLTADVTKLDETQARATGSFVYHKRPVSFDIVMGTHAELQGAQAKDKATIGRAFEINLKGNLLEMRAAGTLSAGDQPQLSTADSSVSITNLREFARWIGLELGTGGGLGAFQARGPMEFSPKAVAFTDANFVLDGNEANGALTFRWDGKRPAIDGTLAFKTFDIAPFVDPSNGEPADPTTAFSVSHYFSLAPTEKPFAMVDQIDADLRVSAATVTAGATKFGRGAASLSLKDGMLLADLAELEIGKGGRCGGQFGFSAEGNRPRYTLRGKIEAIDLAIPSNVLWSYSVLSGTGDITLDLRAEGAETASIIETISGKVSIRQTGSGQVGLDLRTLAATTRAQAQKGWGGATRGQTAIEGLSAEFSIADGRAIAERVGARAGDAALAAQGQVDLTNRLGDVKIWITHPKAGSQSQKSEHSPSAAQAAALTPSTGAPQPGQTGKAPEAADAVAPGGGLQIFGPLDTPEIRFIPLSPPAASDARERAPPPANPPPGAGKG